MVHLRRRCAEAVVALCVACCVKLAPQNFSHRIFAEVCQGAIAVCLHSRLVEPILNYTLQIMTPPIPLSSLVDCPPV